MTYSAKIICDSIASDVVQYRKTIKGESVFTGGAR